MTNELSVQNEQGGVKGKLRDVYLTLAGMAMVAGQSLKEVASETVGIVKGAASFLVADFRDSLTQADTTLQPLYERRKPTTRELAFALGTSSIFTVIVAGVASNLMSGR